jgi:hypothetical protein
MPGVKPDLHSVSLQIFVTELQGIVKVLQAVVGANWLELSKPAPIHAQM